VASFDVTTPEDFEDFEEEWRDNEDGQFTFAPADLTVAVFDAGGTPENYEAFDSADWTLTLTV
jgi:hypothetical protein